MWFLSRVKSGDEDWRENSKKAETRAQRIKSKVKRQQGRWVIEEHQRRNEIGKLKRMYMRFSQRMGCSVMQFVQATFIGKNISNL